MLKVGMNPRRKRYTPRNAPLHIRRMWARKAWSKRSLKRRLSKCRKNLNGHIAEVHAPCEDRGFVPIAECETEKIHDDTYRMPTDSYDPINVDDYQKEMSAFNPCRSAAKNPELLVITSNNPGKRIAVEDKTTGGIAYFDSPEAAEKHTERLRELSREYRLVSSNGRGRRTTMRRKSRNGKFVKIGGKRCSYKSLVKKFGITCAAQMWRKKKKMVTGKKRRIRKGIRKGSRKGSRKSIRKSRHTMRICYTRRRRNRRSKR